MQDAVSAKNTLLEGRPKSIMVVDSLREREGKGEGKEGEREILSYKDMNSIYKGSTFTF